MIKQSDSLFLSTPVKWPITITICAHIHMARLPDSCCYHSNSWPLGKRNSESVGECRRECIRLIFTSLNHRWQLHPCLVMCTTAHAALRLALPTAKTGGRPQRGSLGMLNSSVMFSNTIACVSMQHVIFERLYWMYDGIKFGLQMYFITPFFGTYR